MKNPGEIHENRLTGRDEEPDNEPLAMHEGALKARMEAQRAKAVPLQSFRRPTLQQGNERYEASLEVRKGREKRKRDPRRQREASSSSSSSSPASTV